jgi:hypothetical protein
VAQAREYVHAAELQDLALYGETIQPSSKAEKQASLSNCANWPIVFFRRHFAGIIF